MTIHAFTEPHSSFPAYINLSEQPDGTIKFSIRTRGNDGKDYATIELTTLQAEELADSIYQHNYKEEGGGSTAPTPVPQVAPEQASVRDAALEELIQYHETLARNTSGSRVCYVHHDSIKYIRALMK